MLGVPSVAMDAMRLVSIYAFFSLNIQLQLQKYLRHLLRYKVLLIF